MPSKPDPDVVAFAIQEQAKGRSCRDVQRELAQLGYKVTYVTVAKWARDAKAGKRPTPAAVDQAVKNEESSKQASSLAAALTARQAAQAAQPPPAPSPTANPDDHIATLRELYNYVMGLAAEAKQVSGPGAARMVAQHMTQATALLESIRKAEEAEVADADMLKFPREAVQRATRSILEKIVNPMRARDGMAPIPLDML